MSHSKHEEIIAALWAICALLAFQSDHYAWGVAFAMKAAMDTACAIFMAIKESIAEAK